MKCSNCGAICESGAMFCGECGAKVVVESYSASARRICPACNLRWDSDAMFCGECGTATVEYNEPAVVKETAVVKEVVNPVVNPVETRTGIISTMKKPAETDPVKIEADKQGGSFFHNAGEL